MPDQEEMGLRYEVRAEAEGLNPNPDTGENEGGLIFFIADTYEDKQAEVGRVAFDREVGRRDGDFEEEVRNALDAARLAVRVLNHLQDGNTDDTELW